MGYLLNIQKPLLEEMQRDLTKKIKESKDNEEAETYQFQKDMIDKELEELNEEIEERGNQDQNKTFFNFSA